MSSPRLRMFAGPNGSGKSTLKAVLNSDLWGVYINPDEIKAISVENGCLDLSTYGINTEASELIGFLENSALLTKAGLLKNISKIHVIDQQIHFGNMEFNAYYASVLADFIRQKLLLTQTSFTFETVMSSPDKVQFLKKARSCGYRTYLYFIATVDPEINISRVKYRVHEGGHAVPEEKIVSRYYRSLQLLEEALVHTDRAYLFDNSGHERVWLAEVTEGNSLEIKTTTLPQWLLDALPNFFSEDPL